MQEEVTPQFRSAAQLLICFWFNLTFHSGRTKKLLKVKSKKSLNNFDLDNNLKERRKKQGRKEGRKEKKTGKSSEDKKMRGRTETSPNGRPSANKVSFIFSPKRGAERRREEQRGAECRPLMEG